jgi:uncharacterized protein YqhQ
MPFGSTARMPGLAHCTGHMRSSQEKFNYGGQAVIEGVMMRGSQHMAVAVRHPDGHIVLHTEPLSSVVYGGGISKFPFLRGLTMLWDALGLGMRGLFFSADVALAEEDDVEFGGVVAWTTVALSLLLGIGLFFVLPLVIVGFLDQYIASDLLSNLVEGAIRMAFFLVYLLVMGLIPDIRRVFSYHGAEHKTINAYEADVPLEVEAVQTCTTLHPRCGTGFLLIVIVLSVFVFSLLGRPWMPVRILSRIVLVPLIAMLAYEFIKFSAARLDNPVVRLLVLPGLKLQYLTTREPDDSMIEVAIVALKRVLVLEGLEEVDPKQEEEAVSWVAQQA